MGRSPGSAEGRRDVKREAGPQGGAGHARPVKQPAELGGRQSSKHRGDISEMRFMIEASNRGFGVAKPIGDNERYDVILDRGHRRIWRVQVRGSGYVHQKGFSVRTCWRTCGKRMPYTPRQIDFLAAVFSGWRSHGQQIWYLIPVHALGGRLTITLYPFGTRHDRHPQFEKYRNAWNLLGKPGLRE
jgi:hypothetical protein